MLNILAFFKRYNNFVLGLLIISLFFLQHLVWLYLDHSPLRWDPSNHLTDNLRYFNSICHPSIQSLKDIIFTSLYPPLAGLSLFPFYLIFGESPDKAIVCQNIIYFPILIAAIVLIAKRFNQGKMGLLTIVLLLTYPQIFEISNKYYLDIPLAAMASLSMYLLLLTDNFTNKNNSLILGITIGLGMLTKVQFSIFLIGPLLISAFFGIKDGFASKSINKYFVNISGSFLIAFLIASFWYLPNLKNILIFSAHHAFKEGAYQGHPFPFSFQSLFYYIFTLINNQISFVYIVLFIIGLAFYLKKITRDKILLISWIIFPYLIFTFLIYLKYDRFMLPTLPAFALITSLGLSGLSPGYRRVIAVPAVFIAILQLLSLNFGITPFTNDIKIPLFANYNLIIYRNNNFLTIYKKDIDWGIEKALSAVRQDLESNNQVTSKALVFANHPYCNHLTYGYYALRNNLGLKFRNTQRLQKDYIDYLTDNKYHYSYFIFQTWPYLLSSSEKEIYLKAIRLVHAYPESFKKIFTHKNPDSLTFTLIYKRVSPVETFRDNEKPLEKLQSPITIKNLSIDSSHIEINIDGGVPPYVLKLSSLDDPKNSFYIRIGNKKSFSKTLTSTDRDAITKLGRITVKALDVVENESG